MRKEGMNLEEIVLRVLLDFGQSVFTIEDSVSVLQTRRTYMGVYNLKIFPVEDVVIIEEYGREVGRMSYPEFMCLYRSVEGKMVIV